MPIMTINGRECHVHFRPNPKEDKRDYIPELAELFVEDEYVTFFPVYLYWHDDANDPECTGEVITATLSEARERAAKKLISENV